MPRLVRQSYEQKKALARIRQQKHRAQEDNKIKERERDKLRKRMYRQNPEYAEQCRIRSREYKRKRRAQEDFRIKEREQNKLYKRQCRKNPEFLEKYRERDREYRRRIRAHESYKNMERERDKFYKMMAKQNKKLLNHSMKEQNEYASEDESKKQIDEQNSEEMQSTRQSILRAVRLKFKNRSKDMSTMKNHNENVSQDLQNKNIELISSSSQDFENFAERNMVFIKQEIQEEFFENECENS